MQKGVPQIMDITSIRSVLHDLSEEILPSRFETAQQPEPNIIQFCLRGLNSQTWIEVSWNSDFARILKINRPAKIGAESTLSRQLTCGLKYMALVNIEQDKFERVIKFGFAKKPGDELNKYLIFELMGKHSNIFYLDNNQKIIAVGKQISSNQSSFRIISTGSIYSAPPINLKKEPSQNETYESWKESISSVPESLRYCLINNYQGVSPILTKQLEAFSNLSGSDIMNKNIDFISETNLKKIFKSWTIWIERFKNNNFYFSIFDNSFYSVWFLKNEINDKDNLNQISGLENYYDFYLKKRKIDTLTKKIDGIIFKQINLEKKNFNLQSNLLMNSENYMEYKKKADNIFMTQGIQKKDIIEGQKLYKKSKKLKRAQNLIKERLDIYKNKLDRLEEFSALLDNLNSLKNENPTMRINLLEEIKAEVCQEFNVRFKNIQDQKRESSGLESLPIEIESPTGLRVQIGRNMRQNDLISFKFSKKGDLWFHAQESPGSHVVLKSSSQKATDDDIQLSADLAALFSKAKMNIKVPISLVNIKDLQKITKGGPGCVSFKNVEILWGNPTRGKDYFNKNLKTLI